MNPNIAQTIKAYQGTRTPHDRDRSWEHCYTYFQKIHTGAIKKDQDQAALQLGFYLASWGMYRGSSFLLQYAYTIHKDVVDRTFEPKYSKLWTQEFGTTSSDTNLVQPILDICQDIKNVYQPFADALGKKVSDTLLTKVVLGAIGCFPAWDTFFHEGVKQVSGFWPPSRLTNAFIGDVLKFSLSHLADFQTEQKRIEQHGMRYPLMKLVDMYFHQIGLEIEAAKPGSSKR